MLQRGHVHYSCGNILISIRITSSRMRLVNVTFSGLWKRGQIFILGVRKSLRRGVRTQQQTVTMAYKGQGKVQKVMVQPIVSLLHKSSTFFFFYRRTAPTAESRTVFTARFFCYYTIPHHLTYNETLHVLFYYRLLHFRGRFRRLAALKQTWLVSFLSDNWLIPRPA